MRTRRFLPAVVIALAIVPASHSQSRPAAPTPDFDVMEKSIPELQQATGSGAVTSKELTAAFRARIRAYDKAGPRLNALIALNPNALETADALDRERAAGRVRGPLHGIPIVVKDNFETADMPTTAGVHRDSLSADGLKGARIGVLKALFGAAPEDDEVGRIVRAALEAMKKAGAETIDVAVPGLEEQMQGSSVINAGFKFDLMDYLAQHPRAPVHSLGEILDSGRYHAALDGGLRTRNRVEKRETDEYRRALVKRTAVRQLVLAAMEEHRLDALAYPTLRRPPAIIGEPQRGTNCQLSPSAGLPAIAMPAGFTDGAVPIGVELMGAAWSEPALLKMAFAYEQAVHPRKPPFSAPALVAGVAPPPVTFQAAAGPATASFTWDRATSRLAYTIASSADTLGATVDRGRDGERGPVVIRLLDATASSAAGDARLGAADREALEGGRLYLAVITSREPAGVRAPMQLPAAGPSPADARFEALASLAQEKMREHQVPGVALGILDNGSVTLRGLGVTSVDDPLPITAHTVFPIASISKTFAATAMMRLVEQGRVDLRAPVRRYLPDFRVQDEAVSRDVTIWNLLTHTSGWEGQVSGPDRGEDTLKNFVATIGGLMQLAPPGAAWSYNNAGFSVAGRVIEAVTGKSINAAIRELVFQPLGLEDAGTTAGEFITHRFALGHTSRAGSPATPQRPFVPSTSVTAGGVGLCLTDLLAYAKFHLGDGTSARGEPVLSRKTLELMRTPQLRKQSMDDDIGIAWHLRTVGPIRTAAHGGTLGGHILLLELVPERNFAIAILTNASSGWRLIQDVERAALKSYHGATFATNQAIAHRGLVETLPSVEPLATQPDFAPYVGRYVRPMNAVAVRADHRRLLVQTIPTSGNAQPEMPISFYGPDRAVVTDGQDRGQSIEFVRAADGQVNWIRVTGRIAVRARP